MYCHFKSEMYVRYRYTTIEARARLQNFRLLLGPSTDDCNVSQLIVLCGWSSTIAVLMRRSERQYRYRGRREVMVYFKAFV